ncbi:MAG: hypothetical protein WCZ43_06775 [Proteiniphilum sp.]
MGSILPVFLTSNAINTLAYNFEITEITTVDEDMKVLFKCEN